MKFYIDIIETLSRTVEIDAPDHKTAREKVRQMYDDEEIVLDYNDFSDVQIA